METCPSLRTIRERYGFATVSRLKEIMNCHNRLMRLKNQRVFLLRCKTLQLIPTFLQFNMKHIQLQHFHLENKFKNNIIAFQRSTIQLLISDTTKKINYLLKQIAKITDHFSHMPENNSLQNYLQNYLIKVNQKNKQIKTTQNKKINTLMNKQHKPHTPLGNDNWIVNLSNTELPNEVKTILSLGPNFSMEYRQDRLPVANIIANIEGGIQHLNSEQKNDIAFKISNTIHNFKTKNGNVDIQKNKIVKGINQTTRFLRENKQIHVLRADKTNKTVIMDATEYDQKMNNILQDSNTYTKLNKNPTKVYEKKNNEMIDKWFKRKLITKELSNKMKIHNSQPPKIYGLPKLHKPDTPLRPIVSCIQSPFYKLSKQLASALTPVTGRNDFFIKDSWNFKDFIDTVSISENHHLISLDVISLYTNVPITLINDVINEKWEQLEDTTFLPKPEFLEALEVTLNSTYFQYKDQFYKQVFGCAMGSPVSSVVAQLVMEKLETTVLSSLSIDIPFFKRYVDDCILAVPKNKEQETIDAFNNFNPRLQFTMEVNNNNQINFLDMTLIQTNNKIYTKWYSKPTSSQRYLNYNSVQPKSHKLSVIKGLADRALKLTSTKYHREAIQKITNILHKNNYPKDLVEKTINSRKRLLNITTNTDRAVTTSQQTTKYIALPYVNKLSEKIQHIMNPYSIKIGHSSKNNLASLYTRLKAPTPLLKQSHCVYEIPCTCDRFYIGQTEQLLEERLKGHKYAKNVTALKKHQDDTGHKFNFKDVKILRKETNYKARSVLEVIEIMKNKKAVNDRSDINLSKHYKLIV